MTTLVIEDGTIIPGANSYISLTDAQTYWSNWGINFDSSITTDIQTKALYFACYSMERLYGRLYAGHLAPHSQQPLLWPRQGLSNYHTRLEVQDPTGSGAAFYVRVVDGVIQKVTVLRGGSGYTSPALFFHGRGDYATATCTVSNGTITSVSVTNGGQNYISPRSFIDGNGSAIFNDTIPQALRDAQAEIASLAILNGNSILFPNESDDRILKSQTERIGGLTDESKEYWSSEAVDIERYQGYRKVELILWPILNRRLVVV